jgi:reactive intermediate/imine deaminase
VTSKVQIDKHDDKRDHIVAAAARVFAAKGYSGTTVQNIASELGITGAAIYYYVKNKDELLYLVWQRAGGKLASVLDEIAALSCSPEEKLLQFVRRHLAVIMEDRAVYEVSITQRSELPANNRNEIIEMEKSYQDSVAELITSLGSLKLDSGHSKILAHGLLEMLNGTIRWFKPNGRHTLDEIGDIYYSLFTEGVLTGGVRHPPSTACTAEPPVTTLAAVDSDAAPRPAGTYSQAIAHGQTLYISGQTPKLTGGERLLTEPFAVQARQTMQNLQMIAAAAGTSLRRALHVTVFLRDMANATEFDEVFADFVSFPPPARILIPSELTIGELEITAVVAL